MPNRPFKTPWVVIVLMRDAFVAVFPDMDVLVAAILDRALRQAQIPRNLLAAALYQLAAYEFGLVRFHVCEIVVEIGWDGITDNQ